MSSPWSTTGAQQWSEAGRLARLADLRRATGLGLDALTEPLLPTPELRGRIENVVGAVRIPIGVTTPLRLIGDAADGLFQVPLATTEGTLVLAVSRGAQAITAAGGAAVHAEHPRLTRAPAFVFPSHRDARAAAGWASEHLAEIRSVAESTTNHGRLIALAPWFLGRRLILEFVYHTGDAAGQNMVTFATDAACRWLRERAPFASVEHYTLESNASHDKKIAAMGNAVRRGRQVDAEVTLPASIVRDVLHAEPEAMARVTRDGVYASVMSGAVGAQAQVANVLMAVFLATGQDPATVTECGNGLTIMDMTATGDLYVSVTLPRVIVGTVGGGTTLPAERECLEILGCVGPGRATKLAEIVGGAALAGEVSLVAALASDTFAGAHAAYGRPPQNGGSGGAR
jgi:hydroxymethylglutaryl-CoA reductase (NADPH)